MAQGWDPSRVDRVTEEVDLSQETPTCWCGERATVRKTRRRRLVTLAAGDTCTRVREYECNRHGTPEIFLPNGSLEALVPQGQRFGWDVIVEVGLQRYLERRQRKEIQQELRDRHQILLSTGTISALADRFVYCLGRLHRERAPVLRTFLENQGGYALHIDSTNETGRGGLFVGMEGARNWILGAGRIETEREELLTPVLEEIIQLFGPPLAIVRDMSKACKAAAESWREKGVPNFICHFHFVQDVGRDLLQKLHKRLKQILRSSGALALLKSLERSARQATRENPEQERFAAWIYWLRHGDDRRPVRSPFSLEARDLHARLLALPSKIELWLDPSSQTRNQEALDSLLELRARLAENEELRRLAQELQGRWMLFEELRQILRLEGDELMRPRQPLLPDVEIKAREALEVELGKFENRLELHAKARDRGPHALILRHLQRHKRYLFHHPWASDSQGTILFVVDRTNNALERSFGACKQNLRRRTGRRRLTRDLEDLPPDALLTMNLRDPDYVRILCGSLENLSQAFARLGETPVPEDDIRNHPSRAIQSLVRRLIKEEPKLAATSR